MLKEWLDGFVRIASTGWNVCRRSSARHSRDEKAAAALRDRSAEAMAFVVRA
jgi:hypothetical protein